jgi:isopentenyl-diphosphate Delta-isomerase
VVPPIRHPLFDPTHPARRGVLVDALSDSRVTGSDESVERVVLVDDDGAPIGVADKATVHGVRTPRHLAFSCYGFDKSGRLLVTQRSAGKLTFPGVWTNTCCGHPAPGEAVTDAAARRLAAELGLEADDMRIVLPDFSYRASDGRVEENEFCPVVACTIGGEPTPRPDEVATTQWWSWAQFRQAAADPNSGLSPWARLQAPLLDTVLFPQQ